MVSEVGWLVAVERLKDLERLNDSETLRMSEDQLVDDVVPVMENVLLWDPDEGEAEARP